MRTRRTAAFFVAALTLAVAASPHTSASADDLPAGYGVDAPSGSTFTTAITPAGDADDYAFKGFPGMTVTAVVKAAKAVAPAPALVPDVTIVRPDGTVLDDDAGFLVSVKGTTTTAKGTLDSPGYWLVRVRGRDGTSTGGYSINVVYKLTPTRPTLPIPGKTFTTKNAAISTKVDTDDWRFEAYSGQTIAVTVTRPKNGSLIPGLSLYRPDGSLVPNGVAWDGKSAKVSTTCRPDDTGTWRVRVVGVDPSVPIDPKAPKNTTGPYTLNVKLGKPGVVLSIKPDVNGQYRFRIPAVGGATIAYTLAFKGSPPSYNSFTAPNGVPVPNPGTTKVTALKLPVDMPLGWYTLTFDAPTPAPTNVTFSSKVTPPAGSKPLKITLATSEPIILINGVTPKSGGLTNTTRITVNTTGNLVDPSVGDASKVRVLIDHRELDPTTTQVTGTAVQATVPAGLDLGLHDVVVKSSSGQAAVSIASFEIVPPPRADTIDPVVGSVAGGYPMTITGTGFSKLGDPQIVIDALTSSSIVPVQIDLVTDTEIRFIAPNYGAPGKKTFGIIDNRNGSNGDLLPLDSFEFVSSPAINRVVPSLTTILGGDLITINGTNFTATDHVYLEQTVGSNTYDELSNTFVDSTRHQFNAPVKPKGSYKIYVLDQFFQPLPPRTRLLTYFNFADLAATTAAMFPSGSDTWDGASIAVADFDHDTYDDIVLSRIGGTSASSTPHTRILKNDGTGRFTDVTATAMPAATTGDDWRADRVWAADVNLDGWADIEIVTNDQSVISSGKSHTRILINEQAAGQGPGVRTFRDRTGELFPGPRGGGYDNWRGLDMWVGDIDKAVTAPPEILITHQQTKQELDVFCPPYCSSPIASFYTYGFYWGGSRAFFWDKTGNAGLGKYKFARNFFPRKSGLRVPVGMGIPICNGQQYGSPCVDRFTPFLGKRIAVGDLDADGKLDVAVLSDQEVKRIFPPSTALVTISSLQVGINKFNTVEGADLTDVTPQITAIGGDTRGDAVEIGLTGYPNASPYGTIAMAKAVPVGGGLAMRLYKFKPGLTQSNPYDFEEVTSLTLPTTSGPDYFQASKILFKDVDQDGDQDLLIVCNAPPGGTGPAFRILKNDIVAQKAGVFTMTLMPLLQTPHLPLGSNEHYEGDTMTLGDANHDGGLDFFLVRADPTKPAPQTRIIVTQKQ